MSPTTISAPNRLTKTRYQPFKTVSSYAPAPLVVKLKREPLTMLTASLRNATIVTSVFASIESSGAFKMPVNRLLIRSPIIHLGLYQRHQ